MSLTLWKIGKFCESEFNSKFTKRSHGIEDGSNTVAPQVGAIVKILSYMINDDRIHHFHIRRQHASCGFVRGRLPLRESVRIVDK